jgi:spore coat assembly protein
MSERFQVGDFVTRTSHGKDVLFRIEALQMQNSRTYALLKGVDLRLCADAPLEDLVVPTAQEIHRYRQVYLKRSMELMRGMEHHREEAVQQFLSRAKINYKKNECNQLEIFEIPGTVLHLDGDKEYLDLCLSTYKQLNIRATGFYVPECEQADRVKDYLMEFTPDILILTGHDGLLKGKKGFSNLDSYRNSRHFWRAVRKAREFEAGRDDLIIFAGACQSHYEALIRAGANFASSPRRVLIHAYDPVFIAEKVAFTPFNQMVPIKEALNDTVTGVDGVGGIETRGRLRIGYPKSPY